MPCSPALFPLLAALLLAGGATSAPAAVAPAGPAAPKVTLETGELAGAKFTIARPRDWNRRVLLLAHGQRPEDRPLNADLVIDQLAHRTLLDEGWMIATTSFRRNGLIIADAIADLDNVRTHLVDTYGTPERVLLAGDSMGGLIVTLIAEREFADAPPYAGVVALGAALATNEASITTGLNLQPRIPLLFVSNQTELEGPRNYVDAKVLREPSSLRPMLTRIARDGHVNVNQRERLASIRALNLWLDHGRAALPRPPPGELFFDLTVPPPPQPSAVTLHPDGRGFDARVTALDDLYGNLTLNAQPSDFAAIGVGRLMRFQLVAHDQSFRVLFARDFTSVKRGEWVAYPDADGFTLLARSFAHAALTGRLVPGDTVTLRRFGAAEEKSDDVK